MMMLMIYIVLAIFGLTFGSFVNALVWRIHEQAEIAEKKKLGRADQQRLRQLSISRGRSMCLSCGHELAAKDLVPVVSWLWLRGKCRYCGVRIPDTPVAELLVAILFVVSYLCWPYALDSVWAVAAFLTWLGCCVAFAALALYDVRWYILPDKVVFPLIGLSLLEIGLIAGSNPHHLQMLIGAAQGVMVLFGVFALLFYTSRGEWIGFGDVKLAIALGLLVASALNGLMVILFASVFGLLPNLPGLLAGKLDRTSKIPFGPFLLLAAFIVVLFGHAISSWYLNTLVV